MMGMDTHQSHQLGNQLKEHDAGNMIFVIGSHCALVNHEHHDDFWMGETSVWTMYLNPNHTGSGKHLMDKEGRFNARACCSSDTCCATFCAACGGRDGLNATCDGREGTVVGSTLLSCCPFSLPRPIIQ